MYHLMENIKCFVVFNVYVPFQVSKLFFVSSNHHHHRREGERERDIIYLLIL